MRCLPWLMMLCLLPLGAGCAQQQEVEIPVPRPEPLLGMNLGGGLSSYVINSHLQTGWGRYLETVPATRLTEGIGNWTFANRLREPEDAERILGRLSANGIRYFRYEYGWGHTEYREDTRHPLRMKPRNEAMYRAILQASKRHGFKVVVLLNGHHGYPCPARWTKANVLGDAEKGSHELLLRIEDPSGLRPGYSGISDLGRGLMAEGLLAEIRRAPAADAKAYLVRMAHELPEDYPDGEEVTVATLQYRPFGDAASDAETYAGWGEYVDLLARTAVEEGLRDGEIDFEVWNELTFGSSFLEIEDYDPRFEEHYDQNRLLKVSADAIRRHFPRETNVINGFSNTSFFFRGFWIDERPSGVNAESYHPYGNRWRQFPEHALKDKEHLRLAFQNVDGYNPSYGTLFPEYMGNWANSHDLISLMQPEMRGLLTEKGRAPSGWKRFMTENAIFLDEVDAPEPWDAVVEEQPEHVVAKYWLRMYPFYLNKGLHGVCDGSFWNPPGDRDEQWEQRMLDGDEGAWRVLEPLKRLVSVFEGAVDVPDERLIQLRPSVQQLSGHEKRVFDIAGAVVCQEKPDSEPEKTWDPALVKPEPLYYRDVLCLLPYQLDDSTLTIGAYIQTRNILEDVRDAGRYRISFPGLAVGAGGVTVYDPLVDRAVAADIGLRGGALSVTLTLTDCPVWITLRNVDGPRGGGPVTATLDYDPYVQRAR